MINVLQIASILLPKKKKKLYILVLLFDSYCFIAASWYKEAVETLIDEALRYGGLTTLSDAYTINGQPGDFYDCSNGTIRNHTIILD